MAPHAEGILQVLSALDTLPLPADAANGLIKGAATVLSRLSPETIQQAAKGIVAMQTTALTKTLVVSFFLSLLVGSHTVSVIL